MEFIISREELLKAISRNQSIAERRSTMPVLQNSLIKVEGEKMVTFATDLEVSLEGSYKTSVKTEGSITLPTKRLYEITRELPPKDISFTLLENQQMEIKCDRSRYIISGLSADEFPEMIKADEGEFFEIEKQILEKMIKKSIYAASLDETKKYLNGVYVEKCNGESGDVLRMVSTDGHRLALYNHPLGGRKIPWEKGVIIPRKGVMEVNKIIEDGDGPVLISVQQNHIIFKTDSMTLSVRMVEGTYPDYERVIPRENENTIVVEREALIRSLRRMVVVLTEKVKGVKFEFSKDKIKMIAKNPEIGEAEEDLDADYKGEELQIGFNARYLQEIAGVFEGDKIALQLKDNFTACIINAYQEEENGFAVLMPMRIGF